MAAILFRLGLLAAGMGALEVGIGDALAHGSLAGWALALLVGLPLIVAGSAGFMVPLLSGTTQKGSTDA
ncbi:MAG: hypothetical protein ABIU97_04330 [Dehalococcoidia bacterium]